MKTFCFLSFFIISVCVHSQSNDEQAIRRILNDQTEAWNSGNIENFMRGYWKNDSLMFIGKSGVTRGWKTTWENYKKNYPDTTAMGKLSFYLVQVKQLCPEYFYVVGKWHLKRTIGDLSGHYTLLLKKIKNQWFIISDHSS